MWMDSWVLARPPQLWPKVTLSDGSRQSLLFRVFESQRPCVVLAKSNTAESEVDTEACLRDGVPILRRRGGGGTVVLGPGCQIVTVAFFARSLFDNARLFAAINGAWMQALSDSLGPVCPPLMQRGISDLATVHTHRKVAGTSLFRRKHLVVFQGSLLVNADLGPIAAWLRHPTREPDYREGRGHLDFVTTLQAAAGVELAMGPLCIDVARHLPRTLAAHLEGEFLRDEMV